MEFLSVTETNSECPSTDEVATPDASSDIDSQMRQITSQFFAIADRGEARQYFVDQILPLLKKSVIPREQKRVGQKVTHLIVSVHAHIPELNLLSLAILQPKHVFFVYSEEAELHLDFIQKHAELSLSRIDKVEIDAGGDHTVFSQIYQSVKRQVEHWTQKHERVSTTEFDPQCVAVDISGGKRSTAAACAVAANFLHVRLCFIEHQFASDGYHLFPDSQRIMFFDNPYDVFGDLTLTQVQSSFARCDYDGAAQMLESFAKSQSPTQTSARRSLCRAYAAWDDWRVEEAVMHLSATIDTVRSLARADRYTPLNDSLVMLQHQLEAVKLVHAALTAEAAHMLRTPELFGAILGSLRGSAERFEQRSKRDVAALLWYRMLEFLGQQRLWKQHGIMSDAPDYTGREGLVEKYREARKRVFTMKKKKVQ